MNEKTLERIATALERIASALEADRPKPGLPFLGVVGQKAEPSPSKKPPRKPKRPRNGGGKAD